MKSLNTPQSRAHQQRQGSPQAPTNRSKASLSTSPQRRQGVTAPPVFRPANAAMTAPTVYRPDTSSLQRRQGVTASLAYRPANAAMTAPAVYRPDTSSLQRCQGVTAPPLTAPPTPRWRLRLCTDQIPPHRFSGTGASRLLPSIAPPTRWFGSRGHSAQQSRAIHTRTLRIAELIQKSTSLRHPHCGRHRR